MDQMYPKNLFARHSWMCLVKSSNTEVSGTYFWSASVSWQIVFLESPAAVFLLESWSRSSKFVLIEIDRNIKVQAITTYKVWTDDFWRKFEKSKARTGYTLVRREFAYISLLSQNDRIFAKITKNIIFGRTSSFFEVLKK